MITHRVLTAEACSRLSCNDIDRVASVQTAATVNRNDDDHDDHDDACCCAKSFLCRSSGIRNINVNIININNININNVNINIINIININNINNIVVFIDKASQCIAEHCCAVAGAVVARNVCSS